MKWFLRIFFVLVIANIIAGYVIRQDDLALGEKWIGLAVATGFFIYMPIFLVHRWKGKQLKDYTLSTENLKKMKETLEPEKRKKKT
jgi:pilus assembly protein TadC